MLELKNVSFVSTQGKETKEIINDISLKLDERFVVITGPNGGGKSTLTKLIIFKVFLEKAYIFTDKR